VDGRGRRGRLRLLVAFAALTLAAPSCSFFFVRRPDAAGGGYAQANCTSSGALPTADVVLALLQTVRTLYAVSLSDSDYQGMALSRSSDISFGLTLTTMFATSAVYGFHNVNACREMGGSSRPYERPVPSATRAQKKADEDAEEAAVQARLRARAAAAAGAAAANAAPTVTPTAVDGGADPIP